MASVARADGAEAVVEDGGRGRHIRAGAPAASGGVPAANKGGETAVGP
jgi:hypothetical protein